jgi:hypothetical protein
MKAKIIKVISASALLIILSALAGCIIGPAPYYYPYYNSSYYPYYYPYNYPSQYRSYPPQDYRSYPQQDYRRAPDYPQDGSR